MARKKEIIPGISSVQEFSADGFKRVVNAVKTFQTLPQPGPSWDLYKSYPEFSKSMKAARSKMIPMMVSLLKHANIPATEFKSRDREEKFDYLVDCNDELLERIGTSLDDAEGIFRKAGDIKVVDKSIASSSKSQPPGTWGKRKLEAMNMEVDNPSHYQDQDEDDLDQREDDGGIGSRNRPMKKANYRTRVIEKPQLKFSKPVDNSLLPFVPKLKEKPHSLKPLSILPEYNSRNEEFFGHPYTVELNRWVPKDHMLEKCTPTVPKPVKDTPVIYVSTARDLEGLIYDLLSATEIAVDVEHHSYRTYLGLTCTIQLSTREKDYVIDGLSLREELYNLNEVFADPKILKVFHGASNDIDWLQRDFGLYVVNMFDTYVAARVLQLPQLSLQYLLGRYCQIQQNKLWQLADWRIRPLPSEMLEYARQDTHFLLYIYDLMRNELVEAGNLHGNLLQSVYDQSRMTCLKRYEKPVSNAQLALRKTRRSLNARQVYAFTEIYKWRDEVAREKDESLGYVLPNHMLLTIAETLPKEMNGILACCDPVPPLIHSNLGRIHKIITYARELPLQQQSVQEKDKVQKKAKVKNWIVAVNSIFDITPAPMETETSEITPTPDENNDSNSNANMEVDEEENEDSSKMTWPQTWSDPGGWRKYMGEAKPTLRINQKRESSLRKKSRSSALVLGVVTEDALNTPHGRYEVTKKIQEMINDPKKRDHLDTTDPLVNTVLEAVMLQEEETVSDVEENQAPQLSKVFDEGEFIPFNPMMGGGGEPPHKKRKKDKGKSGAGGKRDKNEEEEYQSVEEIEVVDKDTVSRSRSPSMLQPPPKKNKRQRRGGQKLLNRMKNVFHKKDKGKGKNELNSDPAIPPKDNPDLEDGEIDEIEEIEQVDITKSPQNSRKTRNRTSERFNSNSNSRGKNSFGGGGRGQVTLNNSNSPSSPNYGRGRGNGRGDQNQNQNQKRRDDRRKNKTNIFKAFKKDHRSISFK